jgi:hypothetical protein
VKRLGFVVLVSGMFFGLACARRAEPEGGSSAPVAEDVVSSLEVKVGRDSVELILHATNPTSKPVTLEFNSGQRYDFLILDAGGRTVWQWSSDRMFAQMVGSEVLAPGKGLQYRAVWNPAGKRGSFVGVGRLTVRGRPLEQRAQFEVGR